MESTEGRIKKLQAIDPVSSSSAVNGIAIDTLGFDEVIFLLHNGVTSATGTCDWKIQHDDASGGAYSNITGATVPQVTPTNDNALYSIRVKTAGKKRFMRVVATNATAASVVSAIALLIETKAKQPSQGHTTEVA